MKQAIAIFMIASPLLLFSSERPPFPFHAPKDLSFERLMIFKEANGAIDRTKEVFVSKGQCWRSEVTKPGKRVLVIVFDGEQSRSNSKVKSTGGEDWRVHFHSLYDDLNSRNLIGEMRLGKYECWHFKSNDKGRVSEFWIDQTSLIPRKWILNYPDGASEADYFVNRGDKEPAINYFDVNNLKPIFLTGPETWDPPF